MNGTLAMRTVSPMGARSWKSSSATTLPMIATFAALSSSSALNERPLRSGHSRASK